MENYMLTQENIIKLLPDIGAINNNTNKTNNKTSNTNKTNNKTSNKTNNKNKTNNSNNNSNNTNNNNSNKNNNNNNNNNNNDPFFWIIYKIVEGDYMYETNCNFKTEKDYKIKCIEQLRLIKPKLKIYKLRLNEIENQLLNNKKINIEAFIALAILFNLNIFYIWSNKFFELNLNTDNTIYIINNINDTIIIENSTNKLNFYKETFFNVENINKPLKSISSYIKNDLLLIAQKLNIENMNSKMSKKDLYEKILTRM
jgi:hypothetical protein